MRGGESPADDVCLLLRGPPEQRERGGFFLRPPAGQPIQLRLMGRCREQQVKAVRRQAQGVRRNTEYVNEKPLALSRLAIYGSCLGNYENLKLFIRRFHRLRREYREINPSNQDSFTTVFVHNASSVFIRVHPRPIQSFVFKSFANIRSVFICVYLCLSVLL